MSGEPPAAGQVIFDDRRGRPDDQERPLRQSAGGESEATEPAAGPVKEPVEPPTDERRLRDPGIAEIASPTALDLIQELKPDIRDVDVVMAGQQVRLPQTVRAQDYLVAVTTREVAADHALCRVEINSLKNRAAATRAWETARRLAWFDPRPEATDTRSRPPGGGLSVSR